ncbi:MAG: Gfo/Idh/MocA family oxidoreductase [Planctomycetes bacterium]|nr:Gfo/Idh/MocA family oxidoreductase [Planctomycetota bacterium]
MANWRVGIVGLRRGRGFVSVFAAHPRVTVTALCDLDPKRLADVGDAFKLPAERLYTSFDRFLDAPTDIIVICTPIAFHAEQTIKSLEAGKHVLCEQTAAYKLEDCEKIVQTVKRTGKKYMMAENYSYFHYILEWKKLIQAGKLGAIFYAEAEYVHEIENLLVNEGTGEYYWRHERPPIWYCAHCLGPILVLMDDRIVKACGSSAGFHKQPKYRDHLGFLDMEVGLFRTQRGALIKILRSQVAPRYPHLVYYSLYGTKGYVENGRTGDATTNGYLYVEGETPKDAKGGKRAATVPCAIVDPNAPDEAKKGGHGTSEYYLIRDFLDSIEKDTHPPIDVMRSMDFTIPGIIAHDSAMGDGNWRDVPVYNW